MTTRDSGFELRFGSGHFLAGAVHASLEALDRLGLSEHDRNRLAVLIEELLANLFEHGGAPTVMLRARLQQGHVLLVVEDSGVPFDPRSADLDGPVPERGGGAGLALVRAWCETLDYRVEPSVNRFELRYTLTSPDRHGCEG